MGVGLDTVLVSLAIKQKKLLLYTTLYSRALFYKNKTYKSIELNNKIKIFYKS